MLIGLIGYLRHVAHRCTRLASRCSDLSVSQELEGISAELMEKARELESGPSSRTVSHMVDAASAYLLRALASEQRARAASDPVIKKEWEALAIEWHQLANAATKAAARPSSTNIV
jgi:hypothetical protein